MHNVTLWKRSGILYLLPYWHVYSSTQVVVKCLVTHSCDVDFVVICRSQDKHYHHPMIPEERLLASLLENKSISLHGELLHSSSIIAETLTEVNTQTLMHVYSDILMGVYTQTLTHVYTSNNRHILSVIMFSSPSTDVSLCFLVEAIWATYRNLQLTVVL